MGFLPHAPRPFPVDSFSAARKDHRRLVISPTDVDRTLSREWIPSIFEKVQTPCNFAAPFELV